jgi:hypothetical protein
MISLSSITTTKAVAQSDISLQQNQPAPYSGVLLTGDTYRKNTILKLEAENFTQHLPDYVKCVPAEDGSTKLVSGKGIAVVLVVFILGALAEGYAHH